MTNGRNKLERGSLPVRDNRNRHYVATDFSIARKGSMKYGFLLAAIALLIVAHRAYLMFSPAIYMMLLTAVYVNRTKESFIIKIEGLDK